MLVRVELWIGVVAFGIQHEILMWYLVELGYESDGLVFGIQHQGGEGAVTLGICRRQGYVC